MGHKDHLWKTSGSSSSSYCCNTICKNPLCPLCQNYKSDSVRGVPGVSITVPAQRPPQLLRPCTLSSSRFPNISLFTTLKLPVTVVCKLLKVSLNFLYIAEPFILTTDCRRTVDNALSVPPTVQNEAKISRKLPLPTCAVDAIQSQSQSLSIHLLAKSRAGLSCQLWRFIRFLFFFCLVWFGFFCIK